MNFKNPALSIAMALTFLTASSGIAQETGQESITRATINTPMPGMKAAYEEGVKKHQQWHKEHNDTWTVNVWQITSGPRTGDYVHVTSGHQWGDFDLSRYDSKAHGIDANANQGKFVASTERRFWKRLPELSTIQENGGPAPMVRVIFMEVKPGKDALLTSAIKRMREARAKSDRIREGFFYSSVNSGSRGIYMLVLPQKNWGDMAPGGNRTRAILNEVYGHSESQLIMSRFFEAIEKPTSSVIYVYRPDLSYIPAK